MITATLRMFFIPDMDIVCQNLSNTHTIKDTCIDSKVILSSYCNTRQKETSVEIITFSINLFVEDLSIRSSVFVLAIYLKTN